MTKFEEEVLSIPAGDSYQFIYRYGVHAFPVYNHNKDGQKTRKRSYRSSRFVTFRETGGLMTKLYTLQDTVILNPRKPLELRKIDPKYRARISNYINDRATNWRFSYDEEYQFFLLEFAYSVTKKLPRNLQGHTYLTFDYFGLKEEKLPKPIEGSDRGSNKSQQSKQGGGFGDPEINLEVEQAAIAYVKKWYVDRGWKVLSLENENRGYDLQCSLGRKEENVEVKGIKGKQRSFIITKNEVEQAKSNPDFVICIVTSAFSKRPKLYRLPGSKFIEKFNLEPLSYKASPNTQRDKANRFLIDYLKYKLIRLTKSGRS